MKEVEENLDTLLSGMAPAVRAGRGVCCTRLSTSTWLENYFRMCQMKSMFSRRLQVLKNKLLCTGSLLTASGSDCRRWRDVRRQFFASIAFLLLAASSLPSRALSVDDARHLLTRTGFGASAAEIAALLPLSREQAVDQLLDGLRQQAGKAPPTFVQRSRRDYNWNDDFDTLAPDVAFQFQTERERERDQIRVWWIDEMISTSSPLTERLVLFWHNHFVSKYEDVQYAALLFDQNQTFRRLGTRNFAQLLRAMVRDPALLYFLNNDRNTRQQINENLARELLELFTIGIGNYSQQDVHGLAQVLAGHTLDKVNGGQYIVNPALVVTGPKSLFGVQADLSLDQAVELILQQPQTARFIAEKLYKEFVGPTIGQEEREAFAMILRNAGYDLRPCLRAMLLSDRFWGSAQRGALVKSPVEFVIGSIRSLGIWLPDLGVVDSYISVLGQDLFDPPDVAGWPGGRSWLGAQQFAARRQVMNRLWEAYGSAQRWRAEVGGEDLVVRYSSEESGGVPPSTFAVLVNGNRVLHARLEQPLNIEVEGDSAVPFRPKPMWRYVRVPRSELPADIKTITVHYEHNGDPKSGAMFVNWVQVDGRRLPVNFALQKFFCGPGQTCDASVVPVGMLYFEATLTWDLARARAIEQGVASDLGENSQDRDGNTGVGMMAASNRNGGPGGRFSDADVPRTLPELDIEFTRGGTNSIIEHGVSRLPLLLRPGARPAGEPVDVAGELHRFGLSDNAQTLMLSVPTIQRVAADAVDPMARVLARVQAATLDPAFNLK